MAGVDPRDAVAVAEAVRRWAAGRFGGPVSLAESPLSVRGGFDSYIHLVHLAGADLPGEWCAPLVVRILPSVDRAAQASREADVSRTSLLFEVAAIAATSALERVVLNWAGPRLARRYLRTYQRVAALDARAMAQWEAWHALHGWAQIEMLHAGAFDGASSSSGNEASVPLALGEWLRGRFEANLAALR